MSCSESEQILGTLPGRKESYMSTLNQFVETHINEGINFLERIAAPSIQERADLYQKIEVPPNVYYNALVYLSKHMKLAETRLNKDGASEYHAIPGINSNYATTSLIGKKIESLPLPAKPIVPFTGTPSTGGFITYDMIREERELGENSH
jgi:hypothetical protein